MLLFAAMLPLVLVAGCAGVPHDSKPQVIRQVNEAGDNDGPQVNYAPQKGMEPRQLVQSFLSAGVAADASHSAARQFLTNDAARKWQDGAVTVLQDTRTQLPDITGDTASVQVTGRRVGQLDATGIFTPVLKNAGVGDAETFSYGLKLVDGQWRIDKLPPGVLINQSDFATYYKPRSLYFFNSSETTLVPDLRYAALDGEAAASWMVSQLITGPRTELAQAVVNNIPDQVDPRRVTVTMSSQITVDIPGVDQLDGAGKSGLAAQLAYTLSQIQFGVARIELDDSGRPVSIPSVGKVFSAESFPDANPDGWSAGSSVFYLNDGKVIDGASGKPIAGPLGAGAQKPLSSVALARSKDGTVLAAAVASGPASASSLLVGTTRQLSPVTLPGPPSGRPEWRPHTAVVWIGGQNGSLYRAGSNTRPVAVSVTQARGGLPPKRILALRFSPDGVRLAAVVEAADGTSAVWIGTVVSSGTDVRVESFEPITPAALQVNDVAWASSTTVLMLAAQPNEEWKMWSVQSDGSGLRNFATTGLPPNPPTAIAATTNQVALLSASNSIWAQQGSAWVSLRGSSTLGVNPVYGP